MRDFLGGGRAAFDDMCDRAPDDEVEVVATCLRVVQRSRMKRLQNPKAWS